MSMQEWLNETLAILVLYEKPLHSSTSFNSLSASLKVNSASLDLFIYDNSLNYTGHAQSDRYWRIMVLHDPTNPGVSKAYNEGAKIAAEMGKKWLILLDQDTDFGADALSLYYKSFLAHPTEVCFIPRLTDRVGIMSPFKFQLGNGIRVNSVSEGIHFFKDLQFVNSGIMISVKAFQSVNGYDEDFPLDFSDYAFIEKIRSSIPRFVLTSVTAQHNFSASQPGSLKNDLTRFVTFSIAGKKFRKKYHPTNLFIIVRLWTRALKLSLQHKTLKFFDNLLSIKEND